MTDANNMAQEFFEIEDSVHLSMQGSFQYKDERNARLAALIERERIKERIDALSGIAEYLKQGNCTWSADEGTSHYPHHRIMLSMIPELKAQLAALDKKEAENAN